MVLSALKELRLVQCMLSRPKTSKVISVQQANTAPEMSTQALSRAESELTILIQGQQLVLGAQWDYSATLAHYRHQIHVLLASTALSILQPRSTPRLLALQALTALLST